MLQIFSKKYYLRDLLEGFVDIHNHLLPGIDDGAKNANISIELIQGMKALGVKQFISTPHVMQDFYPNTDETIGNSYNQLLEALPVSLKSEIAINPAAEYMIDDHFETLLNDGYLFTLKSNYVLVEMSYYSPPINLEEILFKMITRGYKPVLAHPERYSFYHNKKDYYKKLKRLGCQFQLNMLSLSSHYGKHVEQTAYYLLDENLIDFIGSDVHNQDHVNKLSELFVGNKKINENLKKTIANTKNVFSVI
ncbi:histidinol phosphatase [Flavobacteriaceae bacterium XHP0103]|uniref:tyrosine-protein phosphatase n=1 Tax=Marixanthotalea marina TaxID=2844359 RepID=UPI002989A98B|nr:CpsB/CapC family capsule biosynthesis tyrosine phosphatase [Marixanthotalea marina]MBU3822275.1 histidinol phosphatase [Marixanthotalea marina]